MTENTIVFYRIDMAPRDNSKEAILDRAVQEASVHGLSGLTIGKLAEAVEMSKGGICAHFPSKSELQVATVERAAYIFRQAVVAPILSKPRGLPRLQALCDAWLHYAESGTFEGGCFFTNAVLELDDIEDTPAREAVRAQFDAFLDLIEGCARDAVEAGHFRRDLDVRQFALALHGIKTGALVWKALGRVKNPFAIARDAMRELIEQAKA